MIRMSDMDENKLTGYMKSFYIKPTRAGMYEIAFEGGGQVPDALVGVFTSEEIAQRFLNTFIKSRTEIPQKGTKRNGAANSNK